MCGVWADITDGLVVRAAAVRGSQELADARIGTSRDKREREASGWMVGTATHVGLCGGFWVDAWNADTAVYLALSREPQQLL